MILLFVFTIGLLVKKTCKTEKVNIRFIGKLSMSFMLVFTGFVHFIFADGMSNMLPESIPFRIEIVYLTGILEILGAIGLLITRFSRLTGIALILFFVAVLPANIYATLNHIDPVTGEFSEVSFEYLFFRIPLQIFFITWVYGFAIAKTKVKFFESKNNFPLIHSKNKS